jgi:chromosome segregation ATPase
MLSFFKYPFTGYNYQSSHHNTYTRKTTKLVRQDTAIMGDQAHQTAIAIVDLNHVPQAMEQVPQNLEAALARIRELEAVNTTLNQQHQELQEKYHLQGRDHDRAITNEDTIEEENDLLQQRLRLVQMQNQLLRGEEETARGERDDLQKQLRDVRGENEHLRSTIAVREGEITVSRFKHKDRIQELERALRKAQDQRAERLSEVQMEQSRCRRQLLDQNVRNNVLQRRVADLEAHITRCPFYTI